MLYTIPTFYVINSTFRVRCLQLLRLPPAAEGNSLHSFCIHKAAHAPLFAQQTLQPKRRTLGSVEALACTDARSDHAVLDFLVTFFIKKKGKNRNYLTASTLKNLRSIQHQKQPSIQIKLIYVTLY